MSGFNRGPWELDGPTGYGDLPGHRVKEPSGYVLAVAIADVPELKAEANARLIAAAPDLLEALEKIADGSWQGEQRFAEDTDADFLLRVIAKMRARARAAIARATGEVG